VTGGAGFIGANLCRALVAHPGVERVVVLDNLSTGAAANLDGVDVDLRVGSILDPAAVADAVAGADSVVHLAARPSVPRSVADPVASHEANATGTLRVLEACRRNAVHVVTASSSSVYGSVADLPKHEDLATRPQSPYAASKLAAEAYTLAYGNTFGVPTLPLRFFNVYGPYQSSGHAYAAVIPAFIDAALRGEPLAVQGDGHQSRDFTFVGTVVRVLTDAVLRRVSSPVPVNLAFGRRIPLHDLIGALASLIGGPLAVQHGPARVGDVRHSQACDARLRALFPTVLPIPLTDGLAQTVDWFRAQRLAGALEPAPSPGPLEPAPSPGAPEPALPAGR
ncbi:MAG TPA: NAD-dependent epimerase/dehydratase family protein, partial [Pilimelia sp.]|nr:NAD-dependent epimerase/dehydratase family protein [Pilimelia sp.]